MKSSIQVVSDTLNAARVLVAIMVIRSIGWAQCQANDWLLSID